VLIVLKSGSLNILEPSGPVKACNGIALPFIQDVSQMFEEISKFGSAHQKKEKFI
jgi:hypothetical protein